MDRTIGHFKTGSGSSIASEMSEFLRIPLRQIGVETPFENSRLPTGTADVSPSRWAARVVVMFTPFRPSEPQTDSTSVAGGVPSAIAGMAAGTKMPLQRGRERAIGTIDRYCGAR
jgi:hypothetical protein